MRVTRVSDTTDLTVEQQAKLAFALTILRNTMRDRLQGWSQLRYPAEGEPHTIRLVKYKNGKLQQAYDI